MYHNHEDNCNRCEDHFCNLLRTLPTNTSYRSIFIKGSGNHIFSDATIIRFDERNCLATFQDARSNYVFLVSCENIIGLEYVYQP